jgi:excisionase family DNA binding protein
MAETYFLRPGSIPYAAAKLAISVPSVYRLIREKKLRIYRIGRAVRISDSAIADCIRKLEEEARSIENAA